MAVVTLAERKCAQTQALRAGFARLRSDLAAYARRNQGRFLIYGSAASDALRYDSDIDIIVDFDADGAAAAMGFAEDACARHGLKPDVRSMASCTPAFLDRITPRALLLP